MDKQVYHYAIKLNKIFVVAEVFDRGNKTPRYEVVTSYRDYKGVDHPNIKYYKGFYCAVKYCKQFMHDKFFVKEILNGNIDGFE